MMGHSWGEGVALVQLDRPVWDWGGSRVKEEKGRGTGRQFGGKTPVKRDGHALDEEA